MVEAGHVVQRPEDPLLEVGALGRAGLAVRGDVLVATGEEPRLEQLDQHPGDVHVDAKRVLDVVLGERRAALAHVACVGAEQQRLPPGQSDREHEGVEAVALVAAVPDRKDGVLEEVTGVGGEAAGVPEPEVVDVRRPRQLLEAVGTLVDDLDAHRREHRQHLRQRQRAAHAEDLQPGLAGSSVERLVEREPDRVLLVDLLEPAQVGGARARAVVLLVGLGEAVGVAPGEPAAVLLAVLGDHSRGEVVAPGPRRLRAAPLEVGDVGLTDLLPRRRPDHEVEPGRERVADVGGVLQGVAVQLLLEDRRDPLADRCVVAVTRQIDQARPEPAIGVAAEEQLELATLAGLHHRRGDRGELLDGRLEDLVARIGLQDVHHRLACVAHRVIARQLEHATRLVTGKRDVIDRLGVGRRGEQAEEPTLADHLALLVELLDPDVVQVHRAVHGRLGVRLGEHEQGLLPRLDRRRLGQGRRTDGVGPQDAEPGARQRDQHLLVTLPLEAVLAVAEEREVVVGEPHQEGLTLGELLGRQRWRVLLEVLEDLVDPVVHLRPVLDRLPDVAEDLQQLLLDVRDQLGRDPVDLQVHPGLASDVVRAHVCLLVEDLLQVAGHVAAHDQLRMDHQVHVVLALRERHRHRVDQERHVVGDHLDDRVALGRPAVGVDGGGEDAHVRGALRALDAGLEVMHDRAVEVDLVAVEQVLGSCVPEVGTQQGRDRGAVVGTRSTLARAVLLGMGAEPGQQLGLAVLQCRRHPGPTFVTSGARRRVTCSSLGLRAGCSQRTTRSESSRIRDQYSGFEPPPWVRRLTRGLPQPLRVATPLVPRVVAAQSSERRPHSSG